jgi:hypothetical protein
VSDTFSAYSLAVFDDGSGPALYAGGSFISDGDLTVNRVARGTGAAQTDEGHLSHFDNERMGNLLVRLFVLAAQSELRGPLSLPNDADLGSKGD